MSTSMTKKHLIVLVHGYLGNDKEMRYLHEALEREAASENVIVYSATSNVGKTTDGIVAGGQRLAAEVLEKVQSYNDENITTTATLTISMVGNSLGGLYSRYAISDLLKQMPSLEPKVFCTTATPHLGVSQHTYISIPNWTEWAIGQIMLATGRDLFRQTSIIHDMSMDDTFLTPLRRFQYRVAYANAYGTDFQVPTSTAAFLSRTDTPHYTVDKTTKTESIILQVTTKSIKDISTTDMAVSLDSLGWTKVFCDVRDALPLPSLWNPFSSSTQSPFVAKSVWTSEQLLQTVGIRTYERFHIPLGHSVMVANSKSDWYGKLNAKGRPIMDQLAKELIGMLEINSCVTKSVTNELV